MRWQGLPGHWTLDAQEGLPLCCVKGCARVLVHLVLVGQQELSRDTLSHAGGPRGRKLDWTLVSGGGLVQPSVLGCSKGVFTEEGVHRTGGSPQGQYDEGSGETAHTQPLPPPMLSTVGPAGR